MPYVQSHTSIRLNKKTERLRLALSQGLGQEVPRYALVGWLHLLWHHVLEFAPFGDVTDYTPHEIAAAAEFPHDPKLFYRTLRDKKWLDLEGERVVVHDWMDYAGEMLKKRLQRAAVRSSAISRPISAAAPRSPAPHVPPAPAPWRRTEPAVTSLAPRRGAAPQRPTAWPPDEPRGFASIRALHGRARREDARS